MVPGKRELEDRVHEWRPGGYVVLFACLLLTVLLTGCGGDQSSRGESHAGNPAQARVADGGLPAETRLEKTPETRKRNVVLIVLEATRARSVTPYNPDLATMPFLDELSKKSLLAKRAYTVVPHTTKALVASECGREPHLVRKITESQPDNLPFQCLPKLLGEQGYKSVWFQNGAGNFEGRTQLVENFGYDEFYSLEDMDPDGFERVAFGREENMMLDPSRQWLEQNGKTSFLATYKTVAPHSHYINPDRYGVVDFTEKEKLNRYLNCIRYVDFFLKNLFDQYKKLGLYDDTIFIIYGDHGEGFGEHGRYQHDNVIYEEGLQIPLIVHDPERWQSGERVDGLANQLDILPTIFDLLNYRVEGGDYPGYSLLDLPEDRTLMFNCWYDKRCLASTHGNEKYIYHYGNRPEQLFDLEKDPLEKTNLADSRKKDLEARRDALLKWRSSVNAMYEQK
ncbi:MAG TPA: sulfatase-like hydrolase/transferase [Rubrobacteraceae bacterium]|nr:sulfatase-like hydrolase/transferase [Rubrobacteraceae bacterium]